MQAILSLQNLVVVAIGAACFGIVFKIPPRFFLHATALAMLAKLGTSIIGEYSHIGFATFSSSFIVGAISHTFARFTGKPAQAFLIPGVMYLVPGTSLYRSFSAALSADYNAAMALLVQAIVITIAISFALLLANWLIPSKKAL